MTRWLARRLLLGVFVVFGAATAAFAAMRLLPGDPVQVILGVTGVSDADQRLARHQLGFDQPIAVQYLRFLGDLFTGDLGRSYQLKASVNSVIGDQIVPTVELALSGLALGLAAAVLVALTTAGRSRRVRGTATLAELTAISSPSFWVGTLLLTFLSFRAHLLPAAGGSGPRAMVLPVVTLAIGLYGVFTQVLREGLERAMEEPFALTSRLRGATRRTLLYRHALRHALVPLVSLSGWALGTLLSGTVVIEIVFSRPGLGRIVAAAVGDRDLPVVSGVVVLFAVVFVVVNITVDLLYMVIDPRTARAGS